MHDMLSVFPAFFYSRRALIFCAVLACLTFLLPAPAHAQGYEGLMEDQGGGYGNARRGGNTGGGYEGLVGWSAQPGATNPYGTAPAADIYQFVRGAGGSIEDRRDTERQAREEARRARQQQIMDSNRQRAEDLNNKLKAASEARQRKLLEQQAEILQRMQQQQQQQPRGQIRR
jgi:hypothetical protein